MHTAQINRIATDAQGRWAVTASHDKTARLWDVASGQLLGVLRLPHDVGDEGKLRAVAMAPDGQRIAVAGWTGLDWEGKASIYLYHHDPQRHTLTLERRLPGLPEVIFHLAFSPDGRWLAAGLGGANGVRVFEAGTGRLTGQDASYGGDCYSVEFRPAAAGGPLELLSSSDDGQLRLYPVDAQGRLGAPRVQHAPDGGQRPFAARFSPDGRRIAVVFDDSRVMQVLDAQDPHELFRPDVQGVEHGALYSVAWSADGRSLVAAGQWRVDKKVLARRWAAQDGRQLGDTPLSGNTVMDLVALPQGGWLFAAQDPTWGVLDALGQVLRRQGSPLADLRDQEGVFQLSIDGQQVRFGFEQSGKQPHVFEVLPQQLRLPDVTVPALAAARTKAPGLQVDRWKNEVDPRLNGQLIELEQYERSRSLSVDADGQGFVLGTNWSLRAYDRNGQLQWKQPVPGAAWAVNQSQDGRWVVAGYGDGTIRWHRRSDGREVLALFAHADKKRWVLWTPEGFYAASEGGEELFGYHLNRGKERDGEFVSARQLSAIFYRPALVTQRLGPQGDALMAEAVREIGTVTDLLAHAQSLPPALTVELPAGQRLEGDTEVTVDIRLEDRGGGIGPVRIFVDGQEIEGRQGASSEGITTRKTYTLRLPPGQQRNLTFMPTSLRGVAGQPSAPVPAMVRGASTRTLHILAVGVQNYPDRSNLPPLRYSVSDAQAVAADIRKRAAPLFDRVAEPVVLTEAQASRSGIDQAFEQLKARMQPQDTLVIFLAGHGEARLGGYTFLPWDYQPGASGPRGEGLNEKRLFEMLQQSPLRTLLLIDTCDAGGMVEMLAGAYQRMNRERQRPVIGASRKGEFAREGYQEHGVFSAALLDVLAATNGKERPLSVVQLGMELSDTVDEISRKMGGHYFQTVTGHTDNGAFPLVRR